MQLLEEAIAQPQSELVIPEREHPRDELWKHQRQNWQGIHLPRQRTTLVRTQ